MQLDFKLKRDGERIFIIAPRNRILGELPAGVFNQLKHYHEVGADIDIDIMDSIPEGRMVFVSIFVDEDQVDDLRLKIAESRKHDRETKKKIQDDIRSKMLQRAKEKQVKRHRRKELRRLVISSVWAMVCAAGPALIRISRATTLAARRG